MDITNNITDTSFKISINGTLLSSAYRYAFMFLFILTWGASIIVVNLQEQKYFLYYIVNIRKIPN